MRKKNLLQVRANLIQSDQSISCSDQLIDQLEDLFENPMFSDVTLNVGAHKFQAHKSILSIYSFHE